MIVKRWSFKSTYRTRDTGWKEVAKFFHNALHFLLDVWETVYTQQYGDLNTAMQSKYAVELTFDFYMGLVTL